MSDGIELLAPAGDMDAFNAAIGAGADAVYLGLDAFNARRNAANLSYEELEQACRIAHLSDRRVYLTVNTLVLDREVDEALGLIARAWVCGIDALIIQDLGLLTLLHGRQPELELHLSTQGNALDPTAAKTARRLGASRITLAREVSLDEIGQIAHEGIEVEVFAHGALCVCYSGQCLMSSLIGRRSANRGLCAQPCRLPYELVEERGDGTAATAETPGPHLLSPKDLCTIDILPQLIATGAASLKIEGRMKSADYVATVVSTYRACLDRALVDPGSYAVSADEHQRLAEAFSRGFTTAYLEGERGNDMMSYSRPNNRGVLVGRVARSDDDRVQLALSRDVRTGDVLEFWTRKGRRVLDVTELLVEGSAVDRAEAGSTCEVSVRGVRGGDRVFRVRSAALLADVRSLGDMRKGAGCALRFSVSAHLGAPLTLDVTDERGRTGHAQGAPCEAARTKAITADEIIGQVGRLGDTPYGIAGFDVDLDDGIGMGFSALHRIRKAAIDDYERRRLEPWTMREQISFAPVREPGMCGRSDTEDGSGRGAARSSSHGPDGDGRRTSAAQCALLTADESLAAEALSGVADIIYAPAADLARWDDPSQAIAVMPTVMHEAEYAGFLELAETCAGVVCDSAWATSRFAEQGFPVEAGPRCNALNVQTLLALTSLGARRLWLSPELSLAQIVDMARCSDIPLTLTVDGRAELMVTEHCELMAMGPCAQTCATCPRRTIACSLRDGKGYLFPLRTDSHGRGHVYNSVELDAVPFVRDLDGAVGRYTVDATLLDRDRALASLARLALALSELDDPQAKPPAKRGDATTGHLFRGVL